MSTEAEPELDLGPLVSELLRRHDTLELLDRFLHATTRLAGAASAAILVPTDDQGLQVLAATSETARDLELFQVMSGEGPAFDCLGSRGTVLAPSIRAMAERWPGFAAVAHANGVDAVLSLHMGLHGDSVGALNVFDPHGITTIDDGRVDRAQQLADLAVLALAMTEPSRTPTAHLIHQSLNRRVELEQAKGVVAEWTGVAPHEAGRLLLSYARAQERLLSEVARDLLALRIDAETFRSATSLNA